MWGGWGKILYVCVYVFIFSIMRLKIICVLYFIFQRFLGPPTTSGIMLFVTLFNGFRPWTNVGKISVLDVVGILEQPLYLFQEICNFIYIFFSSFNFINFLCNIIFVNVLCILCFYKNEINITKKKNFNTKLEKLF